MKRLSMALLAAGSLALSACGGGDEPAVNNVAADNYSVVPEDLGNDVLLGNEALGNDVGLDNATDLGAENAATENASGNAQ